MWASWPALFLLCLANLSHVAAVSDMHRAANNPELKLQGIGSGVRYPVGPPTKQTEANLIATVEGLKVHCMKIGFCLLLFMIPDFYLRL